MKVTAVQQTIVALPTELPKKGGLVLPQTQNEAKRASLYKITSVPEGVSWLSVGNIILVDQQEVLRTRLYETEYTLFNVSAVLAVVSLED